MITKEAIDALAQAQAITAANAKLQTVDGSVITLPNGFVLHDIEPYLAHRRHARGTFTTSRIDDFAAYTLKHREEGATVFVSNDMAARAVLNLGTAVNPGHADNLAELRLAPMAPYTALLEATRAKLTQRAAAEFLEDWAEHVQCFQGATVVPPGLAIAAIRKLTIESARKVESVSQNFKQSATAFESIEATSTDPLPDLVYFTCTPFVGLDERLFVARLGVLTGDAAPSIQLRIARIQQQTEEMSAELADKVTQAIAAHGLDAPVVLGTYRKA